MDFAVKYGYTRERESNKGGHHYDQLPLDPEAEQSRTQQHTDCAELRMLPNHRHSDAEVGAGERFVFSLAGRDVGQTAC